MFERETFGSVSDLRVSNYQPKEFEQMHLHTGDYLQLSIQMLQLVVDVLFVIWSTYGKIYGLFCDHRFYCFLSVGKFVYASQRGHPLGLSFSLFFRFSFNCKCVVCFWQVCIQAQRGTPLEPVLFLKLLGSL